jgi:hypothetical protein
MPELPPDNQISDNQAESPEKIDLGKLGFEELKELHQEILELAKITFKRTEKGFTNINGDGIKVGEDRGKYKLTALSQNLREFHSYIVGSPQNVLHKGANNKDEMIQAMENYD